MTRAVYGSATPKEIYTMAQTCERLPELRAQAESCSCPELTALAGQIDLLDDVKTAILAAIDPEAPSTLKDGGVIAKGYPPRGKTSCAPSGQHQGVSLSWKRLRRGPAS